MHRSYCRVRREYFHCLHLNNKSYTFRVFRYNNKVTFEHKYITKLPTK